MLPRFEGHLATLAHATFVGLGARNLRAVRIADADGNQLDQVYIALTDSEAKQLHDFLEQLMVEKSFHAHVMDDRFWSDNDAERVEKELTICRVDDPSVTF